MRLLDASTGGCQSRTVRRWSHRQVSFEFARGAHRGCKGRRWVLKKITAATEAPCGVSKAAPGIRPQTPDGEM